MSAVNFLVRSLFAIALGFVVIALALAVFGALGTAVWIGLEFLGEQVCRTMTDGCSSAETGVMGGIAVVVSVGVMAFAGGVGEAILRAPDRKRAHAQRLATYADEVRIEREAVQEVVARQEKGT